MGVNSLRKTVTRQRRGFDLNPGPSAPEPSTLTTRLPSRSSHSLVEFSHCIALQIRFCRTVVNSGAVIFLATARDAMFGRLIASVISCPIILHCPPPSLSLSLFLVLIILHRLTLIHSHGAIVSGA